jgi:16S rRNA (cytosine967-C5)-methyltransferase
MEALSRRAPLDLRVNSLKSTISEAVTALLEDGLSASPCPWAPGGLRLPAGAPVTRSDTYLQGLVEIQDEGSQLASLLAGAAPGETVIDLAAGAGGKSLALAGQMANRGRLIAADVAAERLARLAPRALRAGATIIESRSLRAEPGPDEPDLPDLVACADLVLVDAPCSGSGTWRREPEAKWRLSPERLAELIRIQSGLLDRAARLVRPGGRLAYLTCSMLEAENSGVIHAFLERDLEHGANFGLISPYDVMNEAGLGAVPCHRRALGVSLSTGKTGTDGFFMTLLRKGP